MRVSTLQGPKMSIIGEWLLTQPAYVGLPLTFGLSILTGFVIGGSFLKLTGRR